MSAKTLFIGPFSPPFAGDGVKNDYLREGFENEGINNIIWFDSIRRESGIFAFFLRLLKLMITSKQIIISLNRDGRFIIIPLFWFLSLFSRKKGVLYIIGGSFDKQIEQLSSFRRKIFVKMLNRLDGIFAESKSLQEGVEKQGVKNVVMIYNPRKDDGFRWRLTENNKSKVVFISRITDSKGVTVLMNAITEIVNDGKNISLDLYGPIDENYEHFFYKFIADSNGTITYKGILKPDEVQSLLTQYHFLALPTYHTGEGLPGILVEAGMTGIPIIITRFNALPEYFKHNQSALFVEPKDVDTLKKEILRLLEDDKLNKTISSGIIKIVVPFKLETVIKQSIDYLEKYKWIFNKVNE
ncbi:MAG: glycosyltransferase family 4 protein [Marinilabiliaceae bacterium]|nr:glycosyltransferase family 4 protein [Marinilabiliaceae bacterium]